MVKHEEPNVLRFRSGIVTISNENTIVRLLILRFVLNLASALNTSAIKSKLNVSLFQVSLGHESKVPRNPNSIFRHL